MKHNLITTKKSLTKLLKIALIMAFAMQFSGCKKDDPKPEDVPELITTAVLTFTPNGGGAPVVVTAVDPDGAGTQDIKVAGPIDLEANKTYVLTISLINTLALVTDDAYNITAEVEEEGDEHQFFFSWTNNAFSDPTGNGNIDSRADKVNYTGGANSIDKNKRPLGLTTTWTAGAAGITGKFTILLKHQPDLKSDTSDSKTGETDLDLTFDLNVK